jgi:hypothetical protein
LTRRKSANVELSNDEVALSVRESRKDSSRTDKPTMFQHGKITEMRKMGEVECKIENKNNGRCINMYFWLDW